MMKLLLTNDDGIDAAGLQCLRSQLSAEHECYVIAPDIGRSCCSHSVTNATELVFAEVGDRQWSLSGTPADCVRVGLIVLGLKPDWVLSGVNHGGNLGVDTIFSGTVAGAREAHLQGISAIAISQYMRRDVEKAWDQSAIRARRVIETLWAKPTTHPVLWNVNLPALAPESRAEFPITECPLDPGLLPISYARDPSSETSKPMKLLYQSNYQSRPRTLGSDVDLCFSGHAVVTPLSFAIQS
jgi:5'-nucleotidase